MGFFADHNGQGVRSMNEASIMKGLHDGVDLGNQEIRAVMGKPVPEDRTDISEAYRMCEGAPPQLSSSGRALPRN